MLGAAERLAGSILLPVAILLTGIGLIHATPAHAIIDGVSSALDRHMVRVHGGRGIQCSGVAIDRNAVITAAHCGAGSVSAGGQYIAVASHARGTVTLDNGQKVTVVGDSVVAKLRSPLPASIIPLPVGEADHDAPFVIAGYGTPSESTRALGTLREATLVDSKVERHMLVDPNRKSAISASACFGDSGGPVLQRAAGGYVVVGVITRANYPNKPIACGFYTRYAPITSGGVAVAAQTPATLANTSTQTPVAANATQLPRRALAPKVEAERPNLFARFGNYFATQAQAREGNIGRKPFWQRSQ